MLGFLFLKMPTVHRKCWHLKQMDTTGLEQTMDFPSLDQKSITLSINSMETPSVSNFQQQKSKLEDELNMAKIITEDKCKRAIQGEALFKEAKEEFEIIGLELQIFTQEVRELVKEEETIHSQIDAMKKGGGMSFQPSPIIHPTRLPNDGTRNYFIVKTCGYRHGWFHYTDIAIFSCKHSFHSFCLGTMFQNSNKCYVCK